MAERALVKGEPPRVIGIKVARRSVRLARTDPATQRPGELHGPPAPRMQGTEAIRYLAGVVPNLRPAPRLAALQRVV
jgi:hypothetical protein